MTLFDAKPYEGKHICVALSGGVDSVCLLHFFTTCADQFHLTLSAVHIEHGIRGEESLRDFNFCKTLCKDWEIPLIFVQKDVPALSKAWKMGLEETARTVRYEVFDRILTEKHADLIATAHHADDVLETILFRLARGTSPAGMETIRSRKGIIRPLLTVKKTEILQYAAENNLTHVDDSSNLDENITRNYIRRTVLPAFEKIHEGAGEHLLSFAALCARDDAFLKELAKTHIVEVAGEKHVPVNLPEPLFSRACLMCLDAKKDFTGANFSEIAKLKTLQSGRKIALLKGQEAAREYDDIVFYRPETPQAAHVFSKNDYCLEYFAGALKADLNKFPNDCVVRTRQEGDFIVPFGGRKKTLKKFFTDKKISARLGRKLRLIASGSEIFAVFGVEISEKVKVDEQTKTVIFL